MPEKKNSCTEDSNNDFIMLSTVDVCFKGLMNNPKVRKGFIAALIKEDPENIRETSLLPTILRQDYPDDKLGVLDVRVLMEDGRQLDMELQKLPADLKDGDGLIAVECSVGSKRGWSRGGRTKKSRGKSCCQGVFLKKELVFFAGYSAFRNRRT